MPALKISVCDASIKTMFPTFESRWQALVKRDPCATTAFFYCVKSTRIYCRPGCSARLARRKNIVFCDTVAQAEAAGFRACKLCKPCLPLHETRRAMIRQSYRLLNSSSEGVPSLKDQAKSAGLTQWRFQRYFTASRKRTISRKSK